MSDPKRSSDVQGQPAAASLLAEANGSKLLAAPPQEPSNRGRVIGVAVAVVLLALIGGIFLLRGRPAASGAQNAALPPDPYAHYLVFSQIAMSESTSLSGGKSTFIDGHVKNTGPATLTGITMQVLFRNDLSLPPQIETLPLTLIRTHEPYVDTEPVSAAPLKPGGEVEFRLIFETVAANWNQQLPELVVVHVARR